VKAKLTEIDQTERVRTEKDDLEVRPEAEHNPADNTLTGLPPLPVRVFCSVKGPLNHD